MRTRTSSSASKAVQQQSCLKAGSSLRPDTAQSALLQQSCVTEVEPETSVTTETLPRRGGRPTTVKWNEDPERRRAYAREYYQAHKKPAKEKKAGVVDWKDPKAVSEYKRARSVVAVECPQCGKVVKRFSGTHHRRSKFHQLAVKLLREKTTAETGSKENS